MDRETNSCQSPRGPLGEIPPTLAVLTGLMRCNNFVNFKGGDNVFIHAEFIGGISQRQGNQLWKMQYRDGVIFLLQDFDFRLIGVQTQMTQRTPRRHNIGTVVNSI